MCKKAARQLAVLKRIGHLKLGGKILTGSLDKLSAQFRNIYHDFDEGISITFGIYIIHKLVCITCRYQFG